MVKKIQSSVAEDSGKKINLVTKKISLQVCSLSREVWRKMLLLSKYIFFFRVALKKNIPYKGETK
jgi:hypothetical protein